MSTAPAGYVAAHPESDQTSYYHILTDGPLGGREIREFAPLTRYVGPLGEVYEADEGSEPRWIGGFIYEITLWYVHPKRATTTQEEPAIAGASPSTPAAPAHAAPYAPARASIADLGPLRRANLWVRRQHNLGIKRASYHEALWEWECFPERFNLAVTEQATADTPMPEAFYALHCHLVERGYNSSHIRDEIILHARVHGSLHGCDLVDAEDLDALEATLPDAWLADDCGLMVEGRPMRFEGVITETDAAVEAIPDDAAVA